MSGPEQCPNCPAELVPQYEILMGEQCYRWHCPSCDISFNLVSEGWIREVSDKKIDREKFNDIIKQIYTTVEDVCEYEANIEITGLLDDIIEKMEADDD